MNIIINFKCYQESSGKNAEIIAEIINSIKYNKTKYKIIIVVSPFDLTKIVELYPDLEVWTQHLDPINYGANTGKLNPKLAKERGAKGTLINHVEHKVGYQHIKQLIKCVDSDFKVCACVSNLDEAIEIAKLKVDYIAYEPINLIGGNISVTSSNQEILQDIISKINDIDKNIDIICGGGIKNKEDIVLSEKLGTKGILISSGVIKSDNVYDTLNTLL